MITSLVCVSAVSAMSSEPRLNRSAAVTLTDVPLAQISEFDRRMKKKIRKTFPI